MAVSSVLCSFWDMVRLGRIRLPFPTLFAFQPPAIHPSHRNIVIMFCHGTSLPLHSTNSFKACLHFTDRQTDRQTCCTVRGKNHNGCVECRWRVTKSPSLTYGRHVRGRMIMKIDSCITRPRVSGFTQIRCRYALEKLSQNRFLTLIHRPLNYRYHTGRNNHRHRPETIKHNFTPIGNTAPYSNE